MKPTIIFRSELKTGEDLNSLPPDGAVTLFPADTDREDNINEWIGLVKSKKVIDPGRYIKVQSKLEGWIAIYPYTTEDFPEPKNCDRFCRDRMCDETDLVAGYPVELEEVNRRRLSIKREIWERRLDDEVRRLAVEYLEAIASARTAVEQPIQEARREPGNRERAYAQAALAGCQAEVAKAEPGGRNNLLNTVAYRMGRMVARGWVEVGEVEQALWAACDSNGLLREDGGKRCRDSINSGLTAGQGKPHDDLADYDPQTGEVYEDETASPTGRLRIIRASDFAGKPVPQREWVVEDFIPSRIVTDFSGDGGTGKSLAALQLCTAMTNPKGGEWFDLPVTQGPVVYFSAEDEEDEIHRRVADICSHEGIDMASLTGLHIVPLAECEATLATFTSANAINKTRLWNQLVDEVRDIKPKLVTIDTRADAFGGDEIKRVQVRQFVTMLRKMALESDLAVLLLSHPSLTGMASGTGQSGSTAWGNSVRSRLYLKRIYVDRIEPDRNLRIITKQKANYGSLDSEIRLRWTAGVFVRENVQGSGGSDTQALAEAVFLELLRLREGQGRPVSPSPSSTDYAPKIFALHADAKGFAKKAFADAMERLLEAGTIRVGFDGPPSKQKKKIVFG